MLGLRRYTVRLVPHDPRWMRIAEDACAEIRRACANAILDVQHVGSTAVMGMSAKPIIDLVLGLEDIGSFESIRRPLSDIEYIYRGTGNGGVGHLLVRESEPEIRTVHVHVVPRGSTYWKEYVCFRDLLLQDECLRQEYEKLKQENAAAFRTDRDGYTAAKAEFVRGILSARAGLSWE